MPEIIAFSDIQFIFMEPEIAAQGFPSKVYTIMACGKPLIICSPENTPIVNLLSPIGCAKIFTNVSPKEKAEEISDWLEYVTKSELTQMGKRGLELIRDNYSKEVVTQKYVNLIDSI